MASRCPLCVCLLSSSYRTIGWIETSPMASLNSISTSKATRTQARPAGLEVRTANYEVWSAQPGRDTSVVPGMQQVLNRSY